MEHGENEFNLEPKDIPRNWDKSLWQKVWNIASKMSRQELIVFWLSTVTGVISDKDFNRSLEDLTKLSKEQILDMLDEIGTDNAQRLIQSQNNK